MRRGGKGGAAASRRSGRNGARAPGCLLSFGHALPATPLRLTQAGAAPSSLSPRPAVEAVGTVGTALSPPAGDGLPPSPPAAWAAMEKDCQLVFNVEIRGKYIVPFTRWVLPP